MLSDEQNQNVGPGSTALQAGRDAHVTNNIGLTFTEVRQLILDVVKQNFLVLAGEAAEIAERRISTITESFLTQLQKKYPEGLNQARDPDFQHALFNAQKDYARCGDLELEGLLVDMLVDRAKQTSRSILQIVLNESLLVAPKLTPDQIAILSAYFYLNYTVTDGLESKSALYESLDKYLLPFIENLECKPTSFRHLEYSGCGSIQKPGSGFLVVNQTHPFLATLRKAYPGIFTNGFEETDFIQEALSIPITCPIIEPLMDGSGRFRINAVSQGDLNKAIVELEVPSEDVPKLKKLHFKNLMTDAQVREAIIKERPYMGTFLNSVGEEFKDFHLTSVGIAIGHANIKKSVGEFTDLSIWIN